MIIGDPSSVVAFDLPVYALQVEELQQQQQTVESELQTAQEECADWQQRCISLNTQLECARLNASYLQLRQQIA